MNMYVANCTCVLTLSYMYFVSSHRSLHCQATIMMIIIIMIINFFSNYVLNTVVYIFVCYVGGVRAAHWILNSFMHAGVACPLW